VVEVVEEVVLRPSRDPVTVPGARAVVTGFRDRRRGAFLNQRRAISIRWSRRSFCDRLETS